jgi:alpha-glucosidase
MNPTEMQNPDWWRSAVIYQIYPRSFADANNDGSGDIQGVIQNIDYLVELGVDAIWFSPWFPSPDKDGGYDVADYCDIKPEFGTLADAKELIDRAHAVGIKVIIDIVPNHCSDLHEWFQRAQQSPPPSEAWDYFHVQKGRGNGAPPNDWKSLFGGSAWEEIVYDGVGTDFYYLHIFDKGQPDLNWENPKVHAEFDQILRFWFDLGIDGFRVDVAHGLYKAPGYPEHAGEEEVRDDQGGLLDVRPLPFFDQPEVHDVYRRWRSIADEYSPTRMFVAEAWVPTVERLSKYLRKDELHSGFNFGFLMAGWDYWGLRTNIENSLKDLDALAIPTTWVVENHDVPRIVTRFGVDTTLVHHADSGDPNDKDSSHYIPSSAELARGRNRSRAMAMLLAALPGSMYLYQGQELGLDEVRDLPDELRQDPVFKNTETYAKGRDGCRVPLPWTRSGLNLGFNQSTEIPWLPLPSSWSELSVEAQAADERSVLRHHQTTLRIRKQLQLGLGELEMRSDLVSEGILAFVRRTPAGTFLICVNLTDQTQNIPVAEVLLSSEGSISAELQEGNLGADAAVWVKWQA